ncbi:MAG: type II toxin-antitoxin system RelE/ParE family toxin [Candidatus Gastranaerophilales bacterium]
MKEYKIFIYKTNDGKMPFINWLNSIKDDKTQRRIKLRVDRLIDGNFGDTKSVGNNLYELRLFFGPGYRIYYAIDDDVLIILFTGGDKSTQVDDITKAKKYLKDYKGENYASKK